MNYNSLFTIITVCYNASETIERTIKSVLNQSNKDYEYLIVDGASVDNTKEVCKKYIPLFDGRMKWLSEPDKGIYDAMNKGAKLASGRYLLFMNADDLLTEQSLNYYATAINESSGDLDILYGNTIVEYNHSGEVITKERKAYPQISLKTLMNGMGIVHQSMITSTDLFNRLGGFNINYPIGADWDFLIRSVKSNAKLHYIDKPVSVFNLSGASSFAHNKERHRIRKDNNLYTFFDYGMVKDYLRPSYCIQCVFGQKIYNMIRYCVNGKHRNTSQNSDFII